MFMVILCVVGMANCAFNELLEPTTDVSFPIGSGSFTNTWCNLPVNQQTASCWPKIDISTNASSIDGNFPYNSTDTYVCGFKTMDSSGSGIYNVAFVYCHKYRWESQKDQVIYGGASYSKTVMCEHGKYVSKLKIKNKCCSNNNGDDQGYTGIKFECNNLEMTGPGNTITSECCSGDWSAQASPNKFLLGGMASGGSHTDQPWYCIGFCPKTDQVGWSGLWTGWTTPYDCRQAMTQHQDIPDFYVDVDPGSSTDFGKYGYSDTTGVVTYNWRTISSGIADATYNSTLYTKGKLGDWFLNDRDNCEYSHMKIIECTSRTDVTTCTTDVVDNTEDFQLNLQGSRTIQDLADSTADDFFYINADPLEITTRYFILQLDNLDQVIYSNIFTVSVSCPNNIDISVPDDWEDTQIFHSTSITADFAQFKWKSFYTTTKACPVMYYEISSQPNYVDSTNYTITDPGQLVVSNRYEEGPNQDGFISGHLNDNQYEITVMDGELPFQYEFHLKLEILGGNVLWFQYLNLTIICNNDYIPIIAQTTLQTSFNTYQGALNNEARYSFPEYVGNLQICKQVRTYEVEEMNSDGTVKDCTTNTCYLTYPAALCQSPCLNVDINTIDIQSIFMRVKIGSELIATGLIEYDYIPSSSSMIELIVAFENYQFTPPVSFTTKQGDDSQRTYMLDDATAEYTFEPWTCLKGVAPSQTSCEVVNYSIVPSTTLPSGTAYVSSPNYDVDDLYDLEPSNGGSISDPTLYKVSLKTDHSRKPIASGGDPYVFTIRFELEGTPSSFGFSDPVYLFVVCGSQIIAFAGTTLTQSTSTYEIIKLSNKISYQFERDSALPSDSLYPQFPVFFTNTRLTDCPFELWQVCSDSSCSTVTESNSHQVNADQVCTGTGASYSSLITLNNLNNVRESTPSGSLSLSIPTASPIFTTFYLRAKSESSILSSIIEVNVIVCGCETIIEAPVAKQVNFPGMQMGSTPYPTIAQSVYSTWFQVNSVVDSSTNCDEIFDYHITQNTNCATLKPYSVATRCFTWNNKQWVGTASASPVATECGLVTCTACTTQSEIPYALTSVDAALFYWVTDGAEKHIEIKTTLEFEQKQFCLVAETVGGVSIGIVITVEVCGYESINLNAPQGVDEIYHEFYGNTGDGYGTQTFSITDEGFSFTTTSSNPDCSISPDYQILNADQSVDTSGLVWNNGLDIFVSTLQGINNTVFYFRAYSKNNPLKYNQVKIKLLVCGSEEVTVDKPLEEVEEIYVHDIDSGSTNFVISQSQYLSRFENSDNTQFCPIFEYNLMTLQTDGTYLAVNETAADLVRFYGFGSDIFFNTNNALISNENNTDFTFYVQAKTRGNKVNYLKFQIQFIPMAGLRTNKINAGPMFDGFLSGSDLDLVKISMMEIEQLNFQGSEDLFITDLPIIMDYEGDLILSIVYEDLPSFAVIEENISSSSPYKATLQLIIDRLKIDLANPGVFVVTFRLTDSRQESSIFTLPIEIEAQPYNYLQEYVDHKSTYITYTDVNDNCHVSNLFSVQLECLSKLDVNEEPNDLLEALNELCVSMQEDGLVQFQLGFLSDRSKVKITFNKVVMDSYMDLFDQGLFLVTEKYFRAAIQDSTLIETGLGQDNKTFCSVSHKLNQMWEEEYETNEPFKITTIEDQDKLEMLSDPLLVMLFSLEQIEGIDFTIEKIVPVEVVQIEVTKEHILVVDMNQNLMNIDSELFKQYFGQEQAEINSISGIDESFMFLGINGELKDIGVVDEELDDEEGLVNEEFDDEESEENDAGERRERQLKDEDDQDSDEEEDLSIPFVWQGINITDHQIFLQLTFKDPESLSQTTYGYDRIEFELLTNPLIRSKKTGSAYRQDTSKDNIYDFLIMAYMESESIDALGNGAMDIANIAQMSTFILGMFAKGSLQSLWSLVNTMQMIGHLSLLQVPLPSNVVKFMDLFTKGRVKTKYDVTEFNEKFSFTSVQYSNSRFVAFGYKESNFILLQGSLLITISITVFGSIFKILMLFLLKKVYERKVFRMVATELRTLDMQRALSKSLFSCILELMICTFMALYEQSNFLGKDTMTGSDIFSLLMAYQTMLFITGFIGLLCWIIGTKSVEELNSFMIKDRYGIFFYAIETHSVPKASYYLVYISRRFYMSIILVFLHRYPVIQMILVIQSNVAYIGYMIKFKPLMGAEYNYMEIFNETFTNMQTYFLYMLCNANYTQNERLVIGWAFLIPSCLILLVNTYKLVYMQITFIIPQHYGFIINWYKERQVRNFWAEYVQRKKRLFRLHKNEIKYQIDYRNTQELAQMFVTKSILLKQFQQLKKEEKWLLDSDLPTEVLQRDFRKLGDQIALLIIQENRYKLDKALLHGQAAQIEQEDQQQGPNNVNLLSIVRSQYMMGKNFLYQAQMPQEFEDEISMIVEINLYGRLVNYLQGLKFNELIIENDGDTAPKAIACRIYEKVEEHSRVREEVCNYMLEAHAAKLSKLQEQKTTKEVIFGKNIAGAVEEGDKMAKRLSVAGEDLSKKVKRKLNSTQSQKGHGHSHSHRHSNTEESAKEQSQSNVEEVQKCTDEIHKKILSELQREISLKNHYCDHDDQEDEPSFSNLFKYLKIMLFGEVQILQDFSDNVDSYYQSFSPKDTQEHADKMKYLRKMKQKGCPFDKAILEAAAELYDMPIVVFTTKNKRPNFAGRLEPKSDDGKLADPIVLFNYDTHSFRALLTYGQSSLKRSLWESGMLIRNFEQVLSKDKYLIDLKQKLARTQEQNGSSYKYIPRQTAKPNQSNNDHEDHIEKKKRSHQGLKSLKKLKKSQNYIEAQSRQEEQKVIGGSSLVDLKTKGSKDAYNYENPHFLNFKEKKYSVNDIGLEDDHLFEEINMYGQKVKVLKKIEPTELKLKKSKNSIVQPNIVPKKSKTSKKDDGLVDHKSSNIQPQKKSKKVQKAPMIQSINTNTASIFNYTANMEEIKEVSEQDQSSRVNSKRDVFAEFRI